MIRSKGFCRQFIERWFEMSRTRRSFAVGAAIKVNIMTEVTKQPVYTVCVYVFLLRSPGKAVSVKFPSLLRPP